MIIGIKQQDAQGVSNAEDLARSACPIIEGYIQNSGLKQSGSLNKIKVAGKDALTAELTGSSPVGDLRGHAAERDLLVLVARPDGDISYLIFVAPQQDYSTLQPTFEAMLRTFSPQ